MTAGPDNAAATARLTGALERQAEELRQVRTSIGLDARAASRLLRPEQVAVQLAKSRAWVYRHQSELGGFHVGGQIRFEAHGIEAYLDRCRAGVPVASYSSSPAQLLPLRGTWRAGGGRDSAREP